MDKLLKNLEEVKDGEKTPQEAHDRIVDDILRNNLSSMKNFVALVEIGIKNKSIKTDLDFEKHLIYQINEVKKSINFLTDK